MGLDGLLIEEPYPVGWNADTGKRDGKSLYLGCYHSIHTVKQTNGNEVKVMEYDMSAFMEKSVKVYEELAQNCGFYQSIKHADTPFLMEDHRYADSCRPCCDGNYTRCPYCNFTFGPEISIYNGNKSIGNYSIEDLTKLVSVVKEAKEHAGDNIEDSRRYDELLDMFERKLTLDDNAQKWGVGAPCPYNSDEKAPDSGESGEELHESSSHSCLEPHGRDILYEDVPPLVYESEDEDQDKQTSLRIGHPNPRSDHSCESCNESSTLHVTQLNAPTCSCCAHSDKSASVAVSQTAQFNVLRADRRRQLAVETEKRGF